VIKYIDKWTEKNKNPFDEDRRTLQPVIIYIYIYIYLYIYIYNIYI
jgi:hypothetical protein